MSGTNGGLAVEWYKWWFRCLVVQMVVSLLSGTNDGFAVEWYKWWSRCWVVQMVVSLFINSAQGRN